MSVLWLSLILVELFCPVFCDEPAFAARQNPPASVVQNLSEDKKPPTISYYQSTEEEKVCNDECLCHAAAIPSLNIATLKELPSLRETIALRYGKPLFNSLPPPFQPPKNS